MCSVLYCLFPCQFLVLKLHFRRWLQRITPQIHWSRRILLFGLVSTNMHVLMYGNETCKVSRNVYLIIIIMMIIIIIIMETSLYWKRLNLTILQSYNNDNNNNNNNNNNLFTYNAQVSIYIFTSAELKLIKKLITSIYYN